VEVIAEASDNIGSSMIDAALVKHLSTAISVCNIYMIIMCPMVDCVHSMYVISLIIARNIVAL